MSEESRSEANLPKPFAATPDDPGSRRVLKSAALVLLLAGVLSPVAADLAQQAKLTVWYSKQLDVTIPPHPDRFSGGFVATADVEKKIEAQAGETGGDAGDTEPQTFWARVQFVIKKVNDWLHAPPDTESNTQTLIMFWTLVVFILFIIVARIYGVNRVMAVIGGMFGADRFKKLIIDMFILKGNERQIFPPVKETAVKNGKIATHTLNRVELHDVIRVTVGMQGDGFVEVVRDAVTAEGRTAYCFCPSVTGSGGDFYFNLAKTATRTVKISADVLIGASTKKGHMGRLKFDITGFKASAWQ